MKIEEFEQIISQMEIIKEGDAEKLKGGFSIIASYGSEPGTCNNVNCKGTCNRGCHDEDEDEDD